MFCKWFFYNHGLEMILPTPNKKLSLYKKNEPEMILQEKCIKNDFTRKMH